MARPQKSGIDYFPIDVVFDNKIELLDAKYGVEGIGIIVRLWQKVYSNSYFLEWNEETLLLTKRLVNVDINLINAIIIDAVKWGIFDEKMYQAYGILTSKGIQKRYLEAVFRRKEVEVIEEYLLTEMIDELKAKGVNVNINRVNVSIIPKNDDAGTQSKVKESKENKSKENKEVCARTATPSAHRFLKPSIEEVEAYCKERKNDISAEKFIDFYECKGWKVGREQMVDWRACVRTWEQRSGSTPPTVEKTEAREYGRVF